jgi:hypothetical protein
VIPDTLALLDMTLSPRERKLIAMGTVYILGLLLVRAVVRIIPFAYPWAVAVIISIVGLIFLLMIDRVPKASKS